MINLSTMPRLPSCAIPVIALMFMLLLFSAAVAAPAASAGQNARMFAEANSFFQQANGTKDPQQSRALFEKALLRYEQLGREIKNSRIYFNIGNTYCALQDIGRAIVNYRRAQKLASCDRDLSQNLAYALKQRQDAIPESDAQRLLMGLDHFRQNSASGVIVAPEVTARQGDGPAYQPSFTAPLHAGTEFQVVEQRPAWLRVQLADGRRCWLPAESCELI